MGDDTGIKRGGCLCGAVRYHVEGPLHSVVACHCTQCQKTSGNYVTATGCAPENLHLDEDSGLTWYRSSEYAERGFCCKCGGNLFWKPSGGTHISIMAGTLDKPSGLKLSGHIYAGDKHDYFEITDGLPQFQDNAGRDFWDNLD